MNYHAQQILHINNEIHKTARRGKREKVISLVFLLDNIGFNKGLLLARQKDYGPLEVIRMFNFYSKLQIKCRDILCGGLDI